MHTDAVTFCRNRAPSGRLVVFHAEPAEPAEATRLLRVLRGLRVRLVSDVIERSHDYVNVARVLMRAEDDWEAPP